MHTGFGDDDNRPSDPITCNDCGGSGRDRNSPPGMELVCLFCQGAGMVGGEYGEPAHEPPPPKPVDPMTAEPAWENVGWGVPGCPTCAGSGEVISLGGQLVGGTARRGAKMPCPTCQVAKPA